MTETSELWIDQLYVNKCMRHLICKDREKNPANLVITRKGVETMKYTEKQSSYCTGKRNVTIRKPDVPHTRVQGAAGLIYILNI